MVTFHGVTADVAQSVGVIAFGTIMGHGLCTAGAVIGGRLISTKISVKHSELRTRRETNG